MVTNNPFYISKRSHGTLSVSVELPLSIFFSVKALDLYCKTHISIFIMNIFRDFFSLNRKIFHVNLDLIFSIFYCWNFSVIFKLL